MIGRASRLLAGAIGVLLAFARPGSLAEALNPQGRIDPAVRAEFREPPILASKDGVLEVRLVARQGQATLDTVATPVKNFLLFDYELIRGTASDGKMSGGGLYPAPTLQVFPGETLIVQAKPGQKYFTIWHAGPLSIANVRGLLQLVPSNLQRFTALDGRTDKDVPEDFSLPDYKRDVQFTVNGQFQPVIKSKAGQTEIWVLANLSDFAYMNVQLTETVTGRHPPIAIYLHSPVHHGHGATFRAIASFNPFDGAAGTRVATTSTSTGANLLVSGIAQGAGASVQKYEFVRPDAQATMLQAVRLGQVYAGTGSQPVVLGGE